MVLLTRPTTFVCRRCLRASWQLQCQPLAPYSSQPRGKDAEAEATKRASEKRTSASPKAEKKELGPMARRLEEATEEALLTGGRAGRRAIEEAGFSEELKEKLFNKIADAKFRSEHAGSFSQAGLTSSAGEGTRHMAAAQPWTGEESTSDSVLRMLDDAKKPLAPSSRGKFEPPPVDMRLQREPRRTAGEKAASARDKANMYMGMGVKDSDSNKATAQNGEGNVLSEKEKEAYRKELRERFEPGFRAMPNSMAGLAALANERIENAIARGQFKNIPRGTSVERDARADNPFVDTTEYIMNKMIQRQDMVPSWIEKQQELVRATHTFRSRLRNEWRRHAARMIATTGGTLQEQMRRAEQYAAAEEAHNPQPAGGRKGARGGGVPFLAEWQNRSFEDGEEKETTAAVPESGSKPATAAASSPSPSSFGPLPKPFRDPAWESAEKTYHELSVQNLNTIARSYNLMAPDLAKKPYVSLERELSRCYAEVAPQIAGEIKQRATGVSNRKSTGGSTKTTAGQNLLEHLSGGKPVRIHTEAEEKAYGLKEWWRDVWKRE